MEYGKVSRGVHCELLPITSKTAPTIVSGFTVEKLALMKFKQSRDSVKMHTCLVSVWL